MSWNENACILFVLRHTLRKSKLYFRRTFLKSLLKKRTFLSKDKHSYNGFPKSEVPILRFLAPQSTIRHGTFDEVDGTIFDPHQPRKNKETNKRKFFQKHGARRGANKEEEIFIAFYQQK